MLNYKIRPVELKDLDSIAKIETLCFPKAEAASKKLFQERIVYFSECFFVAEYQENLVGFINGFLTNETAIQDIMFSDASLHNPNGIYQAIFGLDVLPDYQHKGIATALMNTIISFTKSNHRKGLILTCKKELIPFYSRFGYQNIGISHSTHGNAVWYDMVLLYETIL